MIRRQRRHFSSQESSSDSSQGYRLGDSSDSPEARSPLSREGKCCKMNRKQTEKNWFSRIFPSAAGILAFPRITSPCYPAPFALGPDLFITPGQNWDLTLFLLGSSAWVNNDAGHQLHTPFDSIRRMQEHQAGPRLQSPTQGALTCSPSPEMGREMRQGRRRACRKRQIWGKMNPMEVLVKEVLPFPKYLQIRV